VIGVPGERVTLEAAQADPERHYVNPPRCRFGTALTGNRCAERKRATPKTKRLHEIHRRSKNVVRPMRVHSHAHKTTRAIGLGHACLPERHPLRRFIEAAISHNSSKLASRVHVCTLVTLDDLR
jgi:hypothetical protein